MIDREEVANNLWPEAEDTFVECDRRYNEGWPYSANGYTSRVAFVHQTLVDIAMLPTTEERDST